MALLDALTALGAGVGRGHRASQALERQLREAHRKALLEEAESKGHLELMGAQTEASHQSSKLDEERTLGLQNERNTLDNPFGGGPRRMSLFNGDIQLPFNTPRQLLPLIPLLTSDQDYQGRDISSRRGLEGTKYAADKTYDRYNEGLTGGAGAGKTPANPMDKIWQNLFKMSDLERLKDPAGSMQLLLDFAEGNKNRLRKLFEEDDSDSLVTPTPNTPFDPKLIPPRPKKR